MAKTAHLPARQAPIRQAGGLASMAICGRSGSFDISRDSFTQRCDPFLGRLDHARIGVVIDDLFQQFDIFLTFDGGDSHIGI